MLDKVIDPAAQTILNQGVLGALTLILMAALGWLYWKGSRKDREKDEIDQAEARVKDWQKIGEIAETTATAMANWNTNSEARYRLLEESVRSQQLLAAQQIQIGKDLSELRTELRDWTRDNSQELARLKEGLLQKGVKLS
jgi:hypothetical protein